MSDAKQKLPLRNRKTKLAEKVGDPYWARFLLPLCKRCPPQFLHGFMHFLHDFLHDGSLYLGESHWRDRICGEGELNQKITPGLFKPQTLQPWFTTLCKRKLQILHLCLTTEIVLAS
jgi:hypothetical protein